MNHTKTIFIVDDDEDDRLLMSEAIRDVIKDIDIVEVHGGADMFRIFSQPQENYGFRLVLMDMNMPRIDGLEMLSIMKQDPQWRGVPVIMISTTSNPGLINKAYELGVNAFMIKPIEPAEFESMAHIVDFCFLNNFPTSSVIEPQEGMHLNKILVIEDNNDHWGLMQFALRRLMPQVKLIRLESRERTLHFLNTEYRALPRHPEFILLDLYMPERAAGLELLREIRQFISANKLVNVPVIVFSYSDHPEDVNAALDGLANAYLVKPPDAGMWPEYFANICAAWSNRISLPRAF